MSATSNFQQLANFIWSVADLLRGPYSPPQYERVMLPLTVLRRFDAVLALSKEAVLKRHAELSSKGGRFDGTEDLRRRRMEGASARGGKASHMAQDPPGRRRKCQGHHRH